MSQNAADLTVQDLRDMRRSFSRQELLDMRASSYPTVCGRMCLITEDYFTKYGVIRADIPL